MSDVQKLQKKVDKCISKCKNAKTVLDDYFKKENFRRAQAELLLDNVNKSASEALIAISELTDIVTDPGDIIWLEKVSNEIATSNDAYVARAKLICAGGKEDSEPVPSNQTHQKVDEAQPSKLPATVSDGETGDAAPAPETANLATDNVENEPSAGTPPAVPEINDLTGVSSASANEVSEADQPPSFRGSNQRSQSRKSDHEPSKRGAGSNAGSGRSKKTSQRSSYCSLTSSQKRQEAKASQMRMEELQRKAEQALKLEAAKAELEQKRLELEQQQLERENERQRQRIQMQKELAKDQQKILMAQIHEESRQKLEEERKKRCSSSWMRMMGIRWIAV